MAKDRLIRYTDLDGNPQEATYWFTLDESEIAEMQIRANGKLGDFLENIVKSQNGNDLIDNFKKILYASVAVREGMRLRKGQDVIDEFVGTGAYNAFFIELLQDAPMAAKFIEGIMPESLMKEYQKQQAEERDTRYTDEELLAMTDEQFTAVAGKKVNHMTKHHLMIAMQRVEAKKAASI